MPINDDHPITTNSRNRRDRWLPAGSAALLVGALVVGGFWIARDDAPGESGAAPAATEERSRAVLTAENWVLADYDDDPKYGGELEYNNVGGELNVHWRLAEDYDDYVSDRQDIGPATTLDVLGKESLMWSYADDDHTVIRPVEGAYTLEFRGGGMSRAAFVDLLSQLRLASETEFLDHLPEEAILESERPAAIADILSDIPTPNGFEAAAIPSSALMSYNLTADVTNAVTCAWVAEYADALEAGDDARVTKAREAAGTARSWSALKEMEGAGDMAQWVWEENDQIADGVSGEALQQLVDNCDQT